MAFVAHALQCAQGHETPPERLACTGTAHRPRAPPLLPPCPDTRGRAEGAHFSSPCHHRRTTHPEAGAGDHAPRWTGTGTPPPAPQRQSARAAIRADDGRQSGRSPASPRGRSHGGPPARPGLGGGGHAKARLAGGRRARGPGGVGPDWARPGEAGVAVQARKRSRTCLTRARGALCRGASSGRRARGRCPLKAPRPSPDGRAGRGAKRQQGSAGARRQRDPAASACPPWT